MFLIDAGDFPFEASDVRADIGLATDRFDDLIRAGIAHACISIEHCRRQVWMVGVDEFARVVARHGEPSKTSAAYWNPKLRGMFRNLTFAARPEAVAAARAKAGRWALRRSEIDRALFEQAHAVVDDAPVLMAAE